MKYEEDHGIVRILESAVVSCWVDVMRRATTGLIQIEYGFTSKATLDYLQIWSSIAGGPALLVCRYWISASPFHGMGIQFGNGYQSKELAHILEVVMQNQSSFKLPANLVGQGMLQITAPTPEEALAAAATVTQAMDRVGSALVQPAVA